jgi:carbamoyltransferase
LKNEKYYLGISAFYHDSAAAILCDGKIVAAAQEERFTRKKHDPAFPKNAVQFCLDFAGVTIDDLDAVVFYDKPLLKFERLLETYYEFSPKGLQSFLQAIPVWINEKLMLKSILKNQLAEVMPYNRKSLRLLFPEHHLSHAASAYYPSGFDDSAILTIDGVGEWATASIAHGKGTGITLIKELKFPHSLGLLYSAFTYYIGFKVNSGEYKLMGLAPYGNPASERVKKYRRKIVTELVCVHDDGSIWLNQKYFDYATGLKMANDELWHQLFGIEKRLSEGEISQEHCDLALAIQQVTEEIVIKMAREAKKETGSKNLCMAGGVALNCVANGKLLKERIFEKIWVQPAAGDAGGALGAAYCGLYFNDSSPEFRRSGHDLMQGSFLGPEFSHLDVEKMARKYSAKFERLGSHSELCKTVTGLLAQGNVVGWFQGRSEWGPRSLGNRSILGDARNPEMQRKLNLKIKFRESFRPFAPVVRIENVEKYFELNEHSPYMLLVAGVALNKRNELPSGYADWPLKEKLYFVRSNLPAITHLDFSARVQTVHQETNLKFWELLKSFEEGTGCGVLVNTSFNVRGEPIVLTPEDAYRCFMRTEMDYLVINEFLFRKPEQPEWNESREWRDELQLD